MRNIFVFFAIFMFPLSALSEDEALRLAEHLFDRQDYLSAITEYKRFIFFSSDEAQTGYAYYRMALSYRAQKDWEGCFEAFKQSIQLTDDSTLKAERQMELGIALIAGGRYHYALSALSQASEISQGAIICRQAVYFQGVAHIYTFNWKEAQKAFGKFYSTSSTSDKLEEKKRVDALLQEAQSLPYKSEKIAKILSTILPGAGQIYAGSWKAGINAFLLNGLITFFVLDNAHKRDYKDASLLFIFVFSRYYLGNRYRAEESVKGFNNRLERQRAIKILSVLTG